MPISMQRNTPTGQRVDTVPQVTESRQTEFLHLFLHPRMFSDIVETDPFAHSLPKHTAYQIAAMRRYVWRERSILATSNVG